MAKSNSGMRRAGGGINSLVNVSPGVRKGAPATGVRPAGVANLAAPLATTPLGRVKPTWRSREVQRGYACWRKPEARQRGRHQCREGWPRYRPNGHAERKPDQARQSRRERSDPPGIRFASLGQTARTRAIGGRSAIDGRAETEALSDQQVAEVLQMLHEGKSQARVAEHFGVSRSAISDIALRKTRTSVPGPRPEKRTCSSHFTGDRGVRRHGNKWRANLKFNGRLLLLGASASSPTQRSVGIPTSLTSDLIDHSTESLNFTTIERTRQNG